MISHPVTLFFTPGTDLVQKRITVIADVCGGQPTIRGMRITVADVLEMLAGGMSFEEILADYSYLEKADIQACLEYTTGRT